MKKTVVASTLAVGLGVTGFAAGNSADASEQGVDKAQLAQQAQSNPESLNEAPVQDGAYNINFNYNNTDYSFQSDGQYWTWSYGQGSTNAPAQETAEQPQQVEQPQQTEQASTEQPAEEAAPQTEETQQPQQEATTQTTSSSNESTSNESSSSEASEGSSVNVNSHLQAIAQRESGGDLKAVNPSSGAAGKYQFLQSTWDSVAPSEYQGVSPTEAPEAVQDAAAVKLYNTAGASQWVTA
ncbi:transglycosylase family protein [Staphylococcus saprophyticus]|uniref:Probable transglycosylase SceD 3 n=5 Tax=Staphylococcus saprophyticus TaxID=29385 RepID=SCED3_STAS1|nr:transglycosylase family protein [Staphylococcus saprophyticus]Q49Z43.1 RecName: Full=Probable transglycosylase SceD 3; Flags: Precursor [Staphylococcus saprophyticus subsp. saprophyticus ATCC 15305 = NCTC 7292]CRV29396.1 Probable transglycosylase sceD precursor [Streptococcus equi subsp. equi]AMG32963.1 transglycosylase SceD 3 [Staphylococcus saprophyticus]ASF19867.1 transglycosylase SceD 3 [Staphylococcus saprophyticus]MBU8681249.1 transglycosylase family protein [Staphylococcus saprophyti